MLKLIDAVQWQLYGKKKALEEKEKREKELELQRLKEKELTALRLSFEPKLKKLCRFLERLGKAEEECERIESIRPLKNALKWWNKNKVEFLDPRFLFDLL